MLETKKVYLHSSSTRMLTLLIDTFQDYWKAGLDCLSVYQEKKKKSSMFSNF